MRQGNSSVRLAAAAGMVAAVLALTAAAAHAHDPLFLTDEQTTPDTGPLLPDGTISFAIYGTLRGDGDQRGFEVEFADGDRLLVEVLVPDLEPETSLTDDELPRATVTAPDGTVTELVPDRRDPFFEPFSNTSYVTISGVDTTAIAGTYQVVISGGAPSRFTVAVGTVESFLTPVERADNRIENLGRVAAPLSAWYSTPPPAAEAAGGASRDEGAEPGGETDPSAEPSADAAADTESPAGEPVPTPESDGVADAGDVATDSEEAADSVDPVEERDPASGATGSAAATPTDPSADNGGDGGSAALPLALTIVASGLGGALIAWRLRRSRAGV